MLTTIPNFVDTGSPLMVAATHGGKFCSESYAKADDNGFYAGDIFPCDNVTYGKVDHPWGK